MTSATRKLKRADSPGLAGMIGADVEVRTLGGGIVRGALLGLDATYLYVERSTNGHVHVVTLAHVVSIVEESSAVAARQFKPALPEITA